MFSLNDLLSLLSHSVKLNIFGSFFEIFNFQIKSSLHVLNSFKVRLEFRDSVHQFDFVLSFSFDACVFYFDDILRNKNCIFVVSGNRKLRYFNPSLLDVNNGFKVIPDFLNSVSSFLLSYNLSFVLIFHTLVLCFKIVDMVLKLSNLVLKLLFILVHFCSCVSFLNKSSKVIFTKVVDLIISLIIEFFFIILFFQDVFNSALVNRRERIKFNYSCHQLLFSRVFFSRDCDLFGFTLSDKTQNLLEIDIWEHLFELSFLIFNHCIIT